MRLLSLAGPALVAAFMSAAAVNAQDAVFVVRLGNDTVAIEQFTRTANRMTGEMVSRLGATGTRLNYEVTLAADGRPATIAYRPRALNGTPIAGQATEIRLTLGGDSVRREAVFPDSTNTRMIAAGRAVPFQSPAFGLLEIAFGQMRKTSAQSAMMSTLGLGANPGQFTFTTSGVDTIRAAPANGFVMIFRADKDGRLQSVDATGTTQKFLATRGSTRMDLNAFASRLAPAGQLSGRGTAFGSFMQSAVFINYGRPQVRGRTVWGGTLVPLDTIWRVGANEATHLATGRELTFGNVVVPPGLYTLFIHHSPAGPQLVVNKQVGQWGTNYDKVQDLGRIQMQLAPAPEHVEEFTITVRPAGQGRGALDFAWGSQVATATFTVR